MVSFYEFGHYIFVCVRGISMLVPIILLCVLMVISAHYMHMDIVLSCVIIVIYFFPFYVLACTWIHGYSVSD